MFSVFSIAQAQSPAPTPVVLLADQIGINNPVPSASLHIKPKYPNGVGAQENVIKFENPNGSTFGFLLSQTLEGNDPNDDVMWWGWNADDSIGGEPSLHFAMERAFGTGDSAAYEVHLEVHPTSAVLQRPWTWTINRKTGLATVVTAADASFYSGGNTFQVLSNEILAQGLSRYVGSVTFQTANNGGTPDKQISVTPYPADNLRSWIQFGQQGGNAGVALVSGNGTLEVHGLNPTTELKGVDAGSYRVKGTQVVGAQCPAIPSSSGKPDDTTRAINAVLQCLRQHGLIAPEKLAHSTRAPR